MNKAVTKLQSGSRIQAKIRLPGSKSITQRALILASLARGESRLTNALVSEDTMITTEALQQLGVTVTWKEETVEVKPPKRRWAQPDRPMYLHNNGTSMRFLLSLAAAGEGRFVFDGSQRLRERPVGPVLAALETLGAACRCLDRDGYPPVEIVGNGLTGGRILVDARQSSQFLSSLLIAAPCARQEVRIGWMEPIASLPYLSLTLAMMEEAGIGFRWSSDNEIAVPAPQDYQPTLYPVEGDCSSASYFWAAAALTAGEVYTYPVSRRSHQGDVRLLEVLEEMGCSISWENEGVRVTGSERLQPVDLDMNSMPDMVPTLAVVAAFAHGRTQIRNVSHLRVKESDRLHAVATELAKFSVPVQEHSDGLVIEGGKVFPPKEGVQVYKDHRIAMAFALAGLCVEGVEIIGAEAVAKSFPTFWDIFERLGGQ
jgi:3-phosphoshikimate 1-carboxyvinyltransferase